MNVIQLSFMDRYNGLKFINKKRWIKVWSGWNQYQILAARK